MLKLLGAFFVLLSCGGLSYRHSCFLKRECRQLQEVTEWLHILEQELSFCRYPLPELFEQVSENLPAPWKDIMEETAEGLQEYDQASVAEVWQESCKRQEGQIAFGKTDYQNLLHIGSFFSYRSMESSVNLLRLTEDSYLESQKRSRREYGNRRKSYSCICYLTGLFVVVLLV